MRALVSSVIVVLLSLPVAVEAAPRTPEKPRQPRTPEEVRNQGSRKGPESTPQGGGESSAPGPARITVEPGPAPPASTHSEAPSPEPAPSSSASVPEWPWGRLADCESGEWDANGVPIPGTRTWGILGRFQGGLQFHPPTWDGFKRPGDPADAHLASPATQVDVAERVQARQGWGAWPECSRILGLR